MTRIHGFSPEGELSEGARLALEAFDPGGGGVTVHEDLTGRSDPNQHPIGAVTGLTATLANKSDADHEHTAAQISDATTTGRVLMQATSAIAARTSIGAAASNHSHDDRYYTESEVDTALAGKADTDHTHDADTLGSGAATDGQVLTADGAGGAAWETAPTGGGGGAFPLHSTRTGQMPGGHLRPGHSTESTATGTIYGTPFLLTTAATLTALSLSVTTAALTPGSLARIAVWSATSPEGAGATLVLDAGTVAIDTTGNKSISLAQALPAGWYVVGVEVQEECTLGARHVDLVSLVGSPNVNTAWASNGRTSPTHLGATHPWGPAPAAPSFAPSGGWATGFTRVLVDLA